MSAIVLTLHIMACLALVVLVLLQSGKEGMGVIFGGGSQSFFGGSGAGSLLAKITAGCAAVFLATSLFYNVLIKQRVHGGSSVMQEAPAPEPAKPAVQFEEPAKPAPAPAEEKKPAQ